MQHDNNPLASILSADSETESPAHWLSPLETPVLTNEVTTVEQSGLPLFVQQRKADTGAKWSWGTVAQKSRKANSLSEMCAWDLRMALAGRGAKSEAE